MTVKTYQLTTLLSKDSGNFLVVSYAQLNPVFRKKPHPHMQQDQCPMTQGYDCHQLVISCFLLGREVKLCCSDWTSEAAQIEPGLCEPCHERADKKVETYQDRPV